SPEAGMRAVARGYRDPIARGTRLATRRWFTLAWLPIAVMSFTSAHASPGSPARTTSAPPGPNLVANPSFETSLAGWSSYHNAVLERVAGGHDGSFAVRAA